MFPGFNNSRKRSSISNGDWDRDGVNNKKDCEPFNYKKQDGGSNGVTKKQREWDSYNQWNAAKKLGDDIRAHKFCDACGSKLPKGVSGLCDNCEDEARFGSVF